MSFRSSRPFTTLLGSFIALGLSILLPATGPALAATTNGNQRVVVAYDTTSASHCVQIRSHIINNVAHEYAHMPCPAGTIIVICSINSSPLHNILAASFLASQGCCAGNSWSKLRDLSIEHYSPSYCWLFSPTVN